MTPEDGVRIPSNICPGTNSVLAFDDIDRLEVTLSGGGTSHCVNSIAIQPVTYDPRQPKNSAPQDGQDKEKIYLCSRRASPNLQCRQASWAPRKEREVDERI